MIFLVDANLPRRLARRLTPRGHISVNVSDWLSADAPDTLISRTAVERKHIIIAKDANYLQFARGGGRVTPLLWLRVGNCSVAHVVESVERHPPEIEASLATGKMIIEIR